MSLRVITGSAKGRRLKVPNVDDLRPTTDRVRQILFDILGDEVVDACVLDCFAGSGALGIEALSRGAAEATFIESNRIAALAIGENLATCGFEGRILQRRFEQAIELVPLGSIDLAFVDPPYAAALGSLPAALEALAGLLSNGATVAIEAPPGLVLPGGYLERRRRRAGSTELVVADT